MFSNWRISIWLVLLIFLAASGTAGWIWVAAPQYLNNRPVAFSHQTQDIAKVVKSATDLVMIAIGLAAVFFEFNESGLDNPGRKQPTKSGAIAAALVVLIGLANLDTSRITDIATQRITDDAANTFNHRLNEAMIKQAKVLADELTPTLEEQKALVTSTTTALQQSLQGTGARIESDLETGANKSAQNLMQVTDVLEYANVPLKGFRILLNLPELEKRLTTATPTLSESDKAIDSALLARIEQHCPPAVAEIGPQGVSFPDMGPCRRERMSRLFWNWTRPLHDFIDPKNHLDVKMQVSFADLFFFFQSKACGVDQINETCFDKSISTRFGGKPFTFSRDVAFGSNLPHSSIDWVSDQQMETNFQIPGITERDIAFPSLTVDVCDMGADTDHAKRGSQRLKDFPIKSEIDVISSGYPTTEAIKTMHLQRKVFFQVYRFHLKDVVALRPGCSTVDYTY